ncbi:MAG: hypothetical protein A2Z11_02990 [Candidatus Woykebacteria bacterium RBG_16_43_9]|uniref:Aspartate/ornithine carbamoyltransferase Asp/Orn-binding domain-containing protein n=1 Tax=Candidatus Woykebacteria bacterium RBG_16_43_9 TaxID=1802596 RepID=A0A1G1WCE7_9BACT|nr:MAG: hypothetical protein A2Z11_02990 [Candidatus Woykebacteria bacterium RBG_16_43_9]
MQEALREAQAWYHTRIQWERFKPQIFQELLTNGPDPEDKEFLAAFQGLPELERLDKLAEYKAQQKYERLRGSYVLTMGVLPNDRVINIFHPLPRLDDIATDVVYDYPGSRIMEQSDNGASVRMALLELTLNPQEF